MSETKKDITSLLELTEKSEEEPFSDFATKAEPEDSFESLDTLLEPETQEAPAEEDFHLDVQETLKLVSEPTQQESPFLFSLRITGLLAREEKQKILELIEKYRIEITPSDLELQWESGQILLPRISEYTAVLLIQSLRTCQARLEAGPSDSIFSTPETQSEKPTPQATKISQPRVETPSSIDSFPMSTQSHIPQPYRVLEALSATAVISAQSVENASTDYEDLLEGLKKKLKYLAFRKNANAILDLKIQLDLLNNAHYRIHLTGTAIRYENLHS